MNPDRESIFSPELDFGAALVGVLSSNTESIPKKNAGQKIVALGVAINRIAILFISANKGLIQTGLTQPLLDGFIGSYRYRLREVAAAEIF
jgi:hypothetical protein